MSRRYKNLISLKQKSRGRERREEILYETLKDSTPIPSTIEFKDIDTEFFDWVDKDLSITFEDKIIPTISLFSSQRFSEYMQSWANVDDKKNMLLNFKAVSRENNPKVGTIFGNTKNIPGENKFLMKRVIMEDKVGRRYVTDYKTKLPIPMDFIYTINLVTNKYELLNQFNTLVNSKFQAITAYIRPKGHFMSMNLTDISDESVYSIDNRQFYSQSFNITVRGYIIPEDNYSVEEHPVLSFKGIEGDEQKSFADIEELPCSYTEESPYGYAPIILTIHFDSCDSAYKFTMDMPFQMKELKLDNIREFKTFINDREVPLDKNFKLKKGDIVKIKSLTKYHIFESAEMIIEGYDYTKVYKKSEGTEIVKIGMEA